MPRIEKMSRPKPNKRANGLMNITSWKMNILETLANDELLGKLLYYSSDDALSKPKLTEEEAYGLVNTHLIGYRYIPDVVKEAGSFISIGISNFAPQEGFRQFSDDFIMGYITFYIMVDLSIMHTEDGYRNDLIASRIYDLFQESRDYGMGELRMETVLELWNQNNKFGGYTMSFKIVDFK